LFPDPPRWLVPIGQWEKAVQQLARIRNTGTGTVEVQREIVSIEFSLEETAQTAEQMKHSEYESVWYWQRLGRLRDYQAMYAMKWTMDICLIRDKSWHFP
jgi:hypothetical protein